MKKYVLWIGLVLMGFSYGSAQEVRLGAKGGVSFSTFSGDRLGNIKSRTGFHIGVLAEFPLSDVFAIQPEILYSTKGGKYSEKGTELGVNYSYRVEQKMDYIDVPVLAKFYLLDGLSVEAGPQISFLTTSSSEYEGSLGDLTISGEDELWDFIKTDFGIAGGISYRLPAGVFFSARYIFGLSNINDVSDSGDRKIHNRNAQISVGYSF